MNKHLFRVIFNRSRGQLMAVAENVAAHGASGGHKKPNHPLRSDPHDAWRFQPSPVSLSLWLLGSAMVLVPVPVFSQIIADPSAPRTQQPTILNTANGLPLVNIQTPSAAGVSRNTYRQFDVNAQGAILNNARSNAQTQLGGWVQANPWLAAGSARVILNEVNSSLPSQLRGYIEVAGARAQVVIANPAGISCDGCGFINANRTTLTTGVPVIGNGALEGYRVSQGTIEVSGAGMDTSQSDFTDLIARAARINAGIWAQDLKISTGTAEINEDHQRLNTLSPTGNAPSYAVDVSNLGGMYAGKIALIGTESGLGVRNAGQIAASAGDVSVSQDGWLDNAGKIVSSGGTSIATTGDLQNTGSIHAQASLLLESNQRVTNSGSLISASDIGIHSGQLSNQGGGLIGAENNVSLVAGTVDNQGSLVTAGQLLSIKTDHLDNRFTDRPDQSKGLQGRDVSVIAGKIDNQTGQVLANRDLYFESTAQVDNSNGLIGSTGNLSIVDSQPAKSLSVVNGGGTLLAGQLLDIQSDHLDGNGQILSQGDIRLSVSRDLSNQSRIQAAHSLELSSEGKVTNQSQLLAGQTIRVAARDFDNTVNGEVNAARTTLNIQDTLANRGLIDGQETGLSSRVVNNIGTGRIYGDHVAIQAGTLNNDQESGNAGTIAARNRLDIGAGILNNREHALLFSAGDMALAGHVDGANNQAAGTAQAINNNSARIEALGNLSLAATTINNTNEHLATAVLPVGNTQYIVEYQGSGSANRYLPGTPGVEIYNDESDHLRTPEGTYEQWMQYAYYRNIQETTVIQTDPGVISSGGNIAISATTLLNDNSHILAGGQLDAAVQTLKNQEAPGKRFVTDSGSVIYFWRQGEKGRDSTGSSVASYNPATVITDISLSTIRFEKNTVGIVGMQLQGQQARTLSASATAIAPFLTNSSLFHVSQNPQSGYLIETDPKFAGYREWLSSDYMLDQLRMDPALLHKRLGDGFYEQKLIREQVAELTGKRFLEGFANDETQYRTLIDNALTYAGQWDLRPGIALTPAQIAQLTSDIVWLVEKDVTLPDGQVTKALVPQVYVRVQEGDLQGSGALLSAGTMNLDIKGDLFNQGTVAGRDVLAINAGTVQNMGGRMTGQDVLVATRNDFNNVGGTLDASRNLGISAGGDLNVTSTTRSNSNAQSSHTSLNRLAGLYVTGQEGGSLTLVAGHDINLTGAGVGNASSQGQTVLAAGHDLNLNTITTTEQQSIVWNGDNWRKDSARQEAGTSIQTNGDLRLSAGNDLNARGASVTSDQGMLLATAGNNVNLTAAGNTRNVDEAHRHKESNSAFSSTTITTRDTLAQTTTQGTIFSGDSVAVQAGKDLQLSGSNVASTTGTTLVAGNDIRIEAATESTAERHFRDEKKSGLFSSGGIGFTIGTQQQSLDSLDTRTTAAASTVGAINGNVTIKADNQASIRGSDVVAGGDIDVVAKEIRIESAENRYQQDVKHETRQSGLTVALSGIVGGVANTAVQQIQTAKETDNGRLLALKGIQAGLTGYQAYQAYQEEAAKAPAEQSFVGISLSVGSQKSESHSSIRQTQNQGSSLQAGDNLSLTATGSGERDEQGHARDGDILIQGSSLQAGQDILLDAARDIDLVASRNQRTETGSNSSSGWNAGASLGISNSGFGLSVSASANKGKGSEDGNGNNWNETTLQAGNILNISSGRDTVLAGTQASGQTIIGDIGRDLTLTSLQDEDHYRSRQTQGSIGGSFTFGSMSGSASFSISKQKLDSDFNSVQEQTGLYAGSGGFDITVDSHTRLNGAVIGSAATADRNRLDTGTLGFGNLDNAADYKVESQSVGMSTGMNFQDQLKGTLLSQGASSLLGGGNSSGHAESTTYAAVSDGTITIRDQNRQQQDVATLSRDVEHAANGLSPIFDKEREQQRLAEARVIGEIGGQLIQVVATDKLAEANRKAAADKDYANSQEYKDLQAMWGTGGTFQKAATAATAALQGLAGNNLNAALAGAAGPYLAGVVKDLTGDNREANILAHAVVGAALAQLKGGNAVAGAAGAGSAPLIAEYLQQTLYPDAHNLTEEQKQSISALTTVASGLLGGLAGGDSAGVLTGMQAGKNEVENNYLAPRQKNQRDLELAACKGSLSCEAKIQLKYELISKQQDIGLLVGTAGGAGLQVYKQAEAVVEMVTNLSDTMQALKVIVTDPDFISKVGENIAQEYQQRIDTLTKAYNDGGWDGSVTAGVETGRLAVDVIGIATATLGAGKVAMTVAKAGKNVASQAITKTAVAVETSVGGLSSFNQLLKNGGLFTSDGRPLMDFGKLSNAQKGMVGDLMGTQKVQQLLPGAQEIGRVPGVGQTGIDALYKVNKPGVDYVVIEYKFGSSKQGMTLDGLQGSDSWLTGANTNYNRILESVGNPKMALEVTDALRNSRIEKWLVHTDPFGRVTVGVMGKDGRLVSNPEVTSKLLGVKK